MRLYKKRQDLSKLGDAPSLRRRKRTQEKQDTSVFERMCKKEIARKK